MRDEIIDFTPDMVQEVIKREPRFKKVFAGFKGDVVCYMNLNGKPMFLPKHSRLIEKVSIAWAGIVFGWCGNTAAEKVMCAEINKCLNGKVYSLKKLAEIAPQIR